MKSLDSNASGELATMHNTFMQSIKELTDLQVSEDPIHSHQLHDVDHAVSTPKLSDHPQRSSIDSRVDEELKQLLETGTCGQEEPDQHDSVSISIDGNDSAEGSDSEIIMHDIDELESVTSPPLKPLKPPSPKIDSIDSKPFKDSNVSKIPKHSKPSDVIHEIIEKGIDPKPDIDPKFDRNDNLKLSIMSPSHLDSDSEPESESNIPEYDLESFGIKEAVVSHSITSNHKSKANTSLRASLPSTSSFENAMKSQPKIPSETHPESEPDTISKSKHSSNASSQVSTPHSSKSNKSTKSSGSIGSAPHSTNLKNLKQKLKSAKKDKMSKKGSIQHIPQSAVPKQRKVSNVPSTPRPSKSGTFQTPQRTKSAFIQTPRHSLKNSRCSSKTTSITSSMANSPVMASLKSLKASKSLKSTKRHEQRLPRSSHGNDQQKESMQRITALQQTLKQREDTIQELNMLTEKQKEDIQRLIEQFEKAKQQQLTIQQDAASKVKDVESQVFALECQLKEAQKGKGETARNMALHADSSQLKTMSVEEVENMANEIKEMDRIIQGLNQENAKLLRQLKEQKIDLRQSQHLMFQENQEISNDLKQTQHRLTELQETKIEELQPAAFEEIQRLRRQLQEVKKTSVKRERELGLEISRLKEQNRELQFKGSGVHGLDKQRFDEESDLIQQFKKEAVRIQKKSQHQIQELKRKLNWYIENQEVIENLHQQITRQNSEIIALKSRSVSLASSPPNVLAHRKPTKNEHREIVVLKKRVHDLERMLSSKHPDSIANLLSMMKGGKTEENANESIIVQQLRDQIATLQDNLDHKEDETLTRLRALRQQNDRVQLQLKKKVSSLEAQIAKSKRDKGFVRPNVKIRGLEQQIVDLKAAHNKKIKTLKDKHLAAIRKEQQDKFGGNVQNSQDSDPNNLIKQIGELTEELDCKTKEVDALNVTINQKQSMIQNLELIVETEKQSHCDLKTQIALLQTQLRDAITKSQTVITKESMNGNWNRMDYGQQREREQIQSIPSPILKVNDDRNEKEQQKLYEENIKILESEVTELKRQCAILTEKIVLEKSKGEQAVKAVQNQLEWSKLEKEKSEQLITKLQFEVNHAKNTPSYVEYETLMRQLEQIEKRGKDREKELEQSYMKLLQTNDDVEERLNRKYEGIISTKNEQIRSLQNELSVLMTAFETIQHT